MPGRLLAKWGRCCGHSAPINCHQVYDSAVAERVLSVHYHSSIAFSGRDVRLLRQDLSQTLWIFICRCHFPYIQPGDTEPVQSSGLLKDEVTQHWSAFAADRFRCEIWVWTTRAEAAGLASQFRFLSAAFTMLFPVKISLPMFTQKKCLLSAARLISSPCANTFTRQKICFLRYCLVIRHCRARYRPQFSLVSNSRYTCSRKIPWEWLPYVEWRLRQYVPVDLFCKATSN